MPVSYRDIAADLRQQIGEGRYMPGDKLPMLTELQAQYGAGYQTVRSAISPPSWASRPDPKSSFAIA